MGHAAVPIHSAPRRSVRTAGGAASASELAHGLAEACAEALPVVDLHVVLRPGRAAEVEAEGAVEPDLLVELALCRAHGRTLRGADPGECIGPAPDDWVLAVAEEQLAAWQRQAPAERARYAELIALTACRSWRFAAERRFCSKVVAGEWVLEHAPMLAAVRAALAARAGSGAAIDDRALLDLLAASRAAVASVRAAG